jgi:hypothetical protein
MKTALVKITGTSPYAQSRFHGEEKLPREGSDDYEQRTWPQKAHVDSEGYIYIHPLAFKKCIAEAAKYVSLQIPGKGKSTYTKHFQSGVLVLDDCRITGRKGLLKAEDVNQDGTGYVGERLFVPADGVAGSGKRVHRLFPVVHNPWTCQVNFVIVDDIITRDVFSKHLEVAGSLIGVGAFRVRNGGIWGRFQSEILNWQEVDAEQFA